MPMIDFSYAPGVYSEDQMRRLADGLEDALRHAIHVARPDASIDYNIIVEGREQGNIVRNVPALNILIFYHAEWEFADGELGCIVEEMKISVKSMLQWACASADDVKIRLYARMGHRSVSLP